MSENLKVIEINGVKLEIDMRYAKNIDSVQVGSRVKVLKKLYGDEYKVFAGVVVGFDDFQELPTINVCYLETTYSSAGIVFVAYNAKSTDIQIVASTDHDGLDVSKADILSKMDTEKAKKELELEELAARRRYFLAQFGSYFRNEKVS